MSAYASLQDLIKLEHKARGFSFLPRQPVHSLLTGRYASRLRGRGLDFEEIRRYQPGDDIRNIDWKVTARTRKPHSRVYTEERDRPAILVVDQRLSMFFGSKVSMKSVKAAEIAALAAWRIFSVGDRVGAVVFNDSEIKDVRPHRSRKRVMEILHRVMEQNHALRADGGIKPDPGMLNRALEHTRRLVKHDYLVCVASDFDGADDDTQRIMTSMAQHNDVIVAFIYDALEMDMPQAGRLVVSDGEFQLKVDSGSRELQKRFSEDFTERLEAAKKVLLKQAVPVLPIHTTEGVAEQVRHLLGYSPRLVQ